MVPFDHNSPEHSADPVASYARLRAEAPVARSEAHGGYWVLSDYDAVFEAARDDAVFSSGRSSDTSGGGSPRCAWSTANSVSRKKGGRPVRQWKARAPSE